MLFLFMEWVIFKMYIGGGVVIIGSICFIICWLIMVLWYWILIIGVVMVMAGIGGLGFIGIWVVKILVIR